MWLCWTSEETWFCNTAQGNHQRSTNWRRTCNVGNAWHGQDALVHQDTSLLHSKMQGQATEHNEFVANVQGREDWNWQNYAYPKWHPIQTYQGHCHRTSQPDEQPSNFVVLLLWGYHQSNRCCTTLHTTTCYASTHNTALATNSICWCGNNSEGAFIKGAFFGANITLEGAAPSHSVTSCLWIVESAEGDDANDARDPCFSNKSSGPCAGNALTSSWNCSIWPHVHHKTNGSIQTNDTYSQPNTCAHATTKMFETCAATCTWDARHAGTSISTISLYQPFLLSPSLPRKWLCHTFSVQGNQLGSGYLDLWWSNGQCSKLPRMVGSCRKWDFCIRGKRYMGGSQHSSGWVQDPTWNMGLPPQVHTQWYGIKVEIQVLHSWWSPGRQIWYPCTSCLMEFHLSLPGAVHHFEVAHVHHWLQQHLGPSQAWHPSLDSLASWFQVRTWIQEDLPLFEEESLWSLSCPQTLESTSSQRTGKGRLCRKQIWLMAFDQANHVDCFVCQWCRSLCKEQTWHWWVNSQAYKVWLWVDSWGTLFWISWHKVCSRQKDWHNHCNTAGTHQENSISDSNERLQPKLGSCISHHTWNWSWWWTHGWGVELPINHWHASLPVDKHLPWHYVCSEPSCKVQPLSQEESCNCCQDDHPLPQAHNQQGNHHSSHWHSTAWLLGWCHIQKSLLHWSRSWAICCQVMHQIHHNTGRMSSCVEVSASIALSTQEGEFVLLVKPCAPSFPLHHLDWNFICSESPPATTASICSRVFEDNNGTLLLAINQCITSPTKHYLIQWHFFWSHIKDGGIEVLHVDTNLQDADYMTKGLPYLWE